MCRLCDCCPTDVTRLAERAGPGAEPRQPAIVVVARTAQRHAKALRDYQSALALGGSRPLPELFSAAGCRFDFTVATVKPLVKLVRGELAGLA